jgi:hypothetical protein
MAGITKPVPKKQCLWCKSPLERKRFNGRLEDRGVFLRRKFCSLSCGTNYQHATEPPTNAAGRKRAQKVVAGCCEICGSTSHLCVHHCDENPKNNAPVNLQTLCGHCHNFWHECAKRAGVSPAGRMPPLFRSQE